MKSNGKNWYVVHTYSGYEERAKANLEHRIETMDVGDKIFQVLVPTEDEVEIRSGQRRTTTRKMFPGYILVQMELGEDSWGVVRNTPGVTGLVASGGQAIPLEEQEVEHIMNRMNAPSPRVKASFSKGDNVRIIDGPFADFIGSVDEVNIEKGKVRLMVSFFGRETPLELDLSHVQVM